MSKQCPIKSRVHLSGQQLYRGGLADTRCTGVQRTIAYLTAKKPHLNCHIRDHERRLRDPLKYHIQQEYQRTHTGHYQDQHDPVARTKSRKSLKKKPTLATLTHHIQERCHHEDRSCRGTP